MADCCNTPKREKEGAPNVADCPRCRRPAKAVPRVTLLHQLAAPHNRQLPDEKFYFCATPGCGLVYFSAATRRFETDHLRGRVGQKMSGADRPLCYCFDISFGEVADELQQCGHSSRKEFVVEQTRLKRCACDIRNPSGHCCLKDFPK